MTRCLRPLAVLLCVGLLAATACGGCEEEPAGPAPVHNADNANNVNNANNANNANNVNNATPVEVEVVEVPLPGVYGAALREYSGMAWHGDTLVLLPQYPSALGNQLVTLGRAQILAYLDGAPADTLVPAPIPFDDGGLPGSLPGFQGFEALAFVGDTAYLTIETSGTFGMRCHVVRAQVHAEGGLALVLEPQTLTEIPLPVQLDNMCHEAVLALPDRVVTFFEANGANVNPNPVVQTFDAQLAPLASLPLARLEYRLTDVTPVDAEGRFWAINYFYPGEADLLDPAPDPLVPLYGEGPTHAASAVVERLVELVWSPDGVTLADRPPLQLRLMERESRNWEGLVRLDDRGLLLVTDRFPTTILAFAPFPAAR
jgi:hypothetical protein